MNSPNSPQQLFNVPLLLLITAALLALFFALFPWKTANYLEREDSLVLKEQFSSRLKTEYHQMLKNDSKNNHAVLALADTLGDKGLEEASIKLLEKKINQGTLNTAQQLQLDLILLKVKMNLYHKSSGLVKDNTIEKNAVKDQLQIVATYQNLSPAQMQSLAEASADFDLFPQAVSVYYQLADNNTTHRAEWLYEAGKWANQTRDYNEAANAFKLASESLHSTTYTKYSDDWLNAAVNAQQHDQVSDFLKTLIQDIPNDPLIVEKLANISAQAGYPKIASKLFNHLSQHDETGQQRWLEKAAHWAKEGEDYQNATQLLTSANTYASTKKEKWVIQQKRIETHNKAKEYAEALAVILPLIESNPNNFRLSGEAVDIAIKAKNISIANRLNNINLENFPNSLDVLNRQVEIETLKEDYKTATNYLKRAIRISPKDIHLREKWAYLAEKQGDNQLATNIWQWVYKYTHDEKHLKKAIGIARNNISEEGLEELLQLSQTEDLPTQTVHDVFYHLIDNNHKRQAEAFLRNYIDTHTIEPSLLATLATWYGGEKQFTKALNAWGELETHFGRTNISSLNRFEMLWLLKRKRAAHKLWINNKSKWTRIANTSQLATMAEVAWTYKHNSNALSYYKKLLNKKYKGSSKDRALQYMRVALLQKKLGQQGNALSTFRTGFIRTANTDLLINGLQLSFDRQDNSNFRRFTALTKRYRSNVKAKPRYWLLQAAYSQRNKNYRTALKYYKKVLSITPNSREARIGVRAIKRTLKSYKRVSIFKKNKTTT